jgi:hypothetical protein
MGCVNGRNTTRGWEDEPFATVFEASEAGARALAPRSNLERDDLVRAREERFVSIERADLDRLDVELTHSVDIYLARQAWGTRSKKAS